VTRVRLLVESPDDRSGEWSVPLKDTVAPSPAGPAKSAPLAASVEQSPRISQPTMLEYGRRQTSAEICSEVERQLLNVHRKLHRAMDRLINRNDYEAAEVVLREVDQEIVTLLNTTTVR